jgi:MFS family permease
LAYFAFFTPIIQLFYLDHGLTITQIAFIGVTWSIVRIISEVPSSVLADTWGRKKVFAVSSLFAVLQMVMLMYAGSYWHFLLASIFSGISYSFLSGTNTALFYDTLKQLEKENQFEKLWARQEIFQQVPLVISFLLSGFLYKISPLLPFQLSLIFLIASLLVVTTFHEPTFYKPVEEVNIFTHISGSMRSILNNDSLKAMLIFTIFFSIGSDLSYYYGQVYLKQLALPIVLFGVAYTLKSLLCALSSNVAPALRRKIGYPAMFAVPIVSITFLLFIMVFINNSLIGATCYALLAIPFGLFVISKDSYIHKQIQSHQRATIDSMFSFVVAIVILILEPVMGYLADLHTIKFPFLLIAMLLSMYSMYYLIWGRKKI